MSTADIDKTKRAMESMNAKKKELLSSALQTRRNKTMQEAASLKQIEKQLAKLDESLSLDVHRLRQRIEEANKEFTQAKWVCRVVARCCQRRGRLPRMPTSLSG